MKLLFPIILLLTGCTNSGMGSIDWSYPGTAGNYSCEDMIGEETPNIQAQAYCATGEHPHLCDC
tara:strand:- start:517 stop:708 length:192 start_codon:yes stop_codon:yes gene_type:complete